MQRSRTYDAKRFVGDSLRTKPKSGSRLCVFRDVNVTVFRPAEAEPVEIQVSAFRFRALGLHDHVGFSGLGFIRFGPRHVCHYSGPRDVGCEHRMILAGLAKLMLVIFLQGLWV